MSINLAILLGNLGRDPEIRSTASGDRCASFSIATSEFWTDKSGEKKETTHWHNVVCWNQHIIDKLIEPHVKKGSRISVQGSIQTRKWQDRDGADRWSTEIVIGRFDGRLTLEGKPQGATRDEHGYGETKGRADANARAASVVKGGARNADLDDDIPF